MVKEKSMKQLNDNSLEAGQKPYSAPLKKPNRNLMIVIGVLIVLFVAFLALLILVSKQKRIAIEKKLVNNQIIMSSSPTQSIQLGNFKDFKDDGLGIYFKFPESWGDLVIKNNFALTENIREISFLGEPRVKLISFTEHRQYPSGYAEIGVSNGGGVVSFCVDRLDYLQGNPPVTTNGQDVFRHNGAYNFGDCDTKPRFLNISQKMRTGWVDLDNPKTSTVPIELSRSFFWDLQNPVYGSLNLVVDIPDINTCESCKVEFFYGGTDYRLEKIPLCINHKEKDWIEIAFKNFDATQLSMEVDYLSKSLQVYSADVAVLEYENYFKDKSVFKDADLGISFSYPSAFGEPKYDLTSRTLAFPDDEDNYTNEAMRIEVTSLADITKEEKAFVECENECPGCIGQCFGPLFTKEKWEKEKDILAKSSTGQIPCDSKDDYCEIVNNGNIKMSAIYYKNPQWQESDRMRKQYTFYTNDKRFDIFTNSYEVDVISFAEYREKEKTDFILKLVQEILESIRIEK